jgi:small subunit ribosomal protein S20
LANIKSQIKRNRQNDKRRLRNRVYRGEARIAVREARVAIGTSAPESKEELLKAISTLDKAAEKGVLHKNNVSRRKSRLMKAFNGMKPLEVKIEEPTAKVEPVEEPKKAAAARKKSSKAEPKADVKKSAVKKTAAKTETKKTETKKTGSAKKTVARKPAAKK